MKTGYPALGELVLCIFLGTLATGHSEQGLPEWEQTRLAAEKGDKVAQHKFADIYMLQGNYSTAFEWFHKAADQGDVDAQYRIGQMLMDGKPKVLSESKPVPKDQDEAIKWLFLAADQGHRTAQIDLAGCFEVGKVVNQDMVEAYKWYKLVAEKTPGGDRTFMNRLV